MAGRYLSQKGMIKVTETHESAAQPPGLDAGLYLLLAPIIAIVLCWLWIAGLFDLRDPARVLVWVLLGAIGITAILGAVESERCKHTEYSPMNPFTPLNWFFVMALIWPLGYPAYMHQRHYYGLEKRLGSGLLVMLALIGTGIAVMLEIDSRTNELVRAIQQYQQSIAR